GDSPGTETMNNSKTSSAWVLGICLVLGFSSLGYLLGQAAIRYKEYERTVTVKGLSEREYPADIVIWPIPFTAANNDLGALYEALEKSAGQIREYLQAAGIEASEISMSVPLITDRAAQQWGDSSQAEFRYVAVQTVTVYSVQVDQVRTLMGGLIELGKRGIVFSGDAYQSQVEYLFTRLNEIKPGMIEEATTAAREIGIKFANDSNSKLGKIRTASQGQFSIEPRDTNNPHIKKVRVVSTVEYYLSD
ncbi:MAG: SIMPL domain-containing protein, partial [Lysobacterales bacterium]